MNTPGKVLHGVGSKASWDEIAGDALQFDEDDPSLRQ